MDQETQIRTLVYRYMICGILTCFLTVFGATISAAWEDSVRDDDESSVQITKTRELNFGSIFTTPAPGTVTISPSGLRTSTGGVYLYSGVGSVVSSASFKITQSKSDDEHEDDSKKKGKGDDGSDNVNVSIMLPSSVKLVRSGGSETMTADQFTQTLTNNVLNVGARLHVNANQRGGTYTGTIYVTAVCN